MLITPILFDNPGKYADFTIILPNGEQKKLHKCILSLIPGFHRYLARNYLILKYAITYHEGFRHLYTGKFSDAWRSTSYTCNERLLGIEEMMSLGFVHRVNDTTILFHYLNTSLLFNSPLTYPDCTINYLGEKRHIHRTVLGCYLENIPDTDLRCNSLVTIEVGIRALYGGVFARWFEQYSDEQIEIGIQEISSLGIGKLIPLPLPNAFDDSLSHFFKKCWRFYVNLRPDLMQSLALYLDEDSGILPDDAIFHHCPSKLQYSILIKHPTHINKILSLHSYFTPQYLSDDVKYKTFAKAFDEHRYRITSLNPLEFTYIVPIGKVRGYIKKYNAFVMKSTYHVDLSTKFTLHQGLYTRDRPLEISGVYDNNWESGKCTFMLPGIYYSFGLSNNKNNPPKRTIIYLRQKRYYVDFYNPHNTFLSILPRDIANIIEPMLYR